MMVVRKALLFLTIYVAVKCSTAVTNTSNSVPTSASKQTTAAATVQSNNQLAYVNGDLVRLINNCTVGVTSSCPYNYCCTKKYMVYNPGYIGSKPVYQMECKPLRNSGEFCYFQTPEQFCPCATRCHTNGFYGSCL